MEHSNFYVPNNKLKQETLTNNLNHDSHQLCFNGHISKRQRINKNNTINWICKISKCSGSVTILIGQEKVEHSNNCECEDDDDNEPEAREPLDDVLVVQEKSLGLNINVTCILD
ncbi:unnamed protein product [Brachionus calyciflorus]|uniref:FLYWCH-type domain-containing protein n=1 Tax=Brachionus calyciflorus TaxID=104777 RepID=A0A814FAJ6_9BILA|nr:unnamed protein product [Brachionus calyciflorus]